ncbi:MAG: antitoxin [Alphaproteobacteria bacterium]|nr:antitoxin [Alphaproteobacteria bacterium]
MPLYIRSEEADALARELAARTGMTITDAVTSALAEKLARTPPPADDDHRRAFLETVRKVQSAAAAEPIHDPRDHGEMLYDEAGAPR